MSAPALVKKTARIAMPDNGGLRLAAVADTHSRPHVDGISHLTRLRPHAIIHAGDIGDRAVLAQLGAVAPVFAVRGNIDARAEGLADVLLLDITNGGHGADGPDVGSREDGGGHFRILVIHIAVTGPRLRAEVSRMARAEGASLIVCGHSHVPFMGRDRELVFFNPGSIGPRRFHLPILFGIIDVTPAGVRLAHYDCETGRPWTPPADV